MANDSINALKPVTMANTKELKYFVKANPITSAKGGILEIWIDGERHTTTIDADGNWSFTPPNNWAEGLHTVSLVSVDRAGNRSLPTALIVNADRTAPAQPEIWRVVEGSGSDNVNLTPGDSSKEHKPVVSGVAEPGSTVYLYDQSGTTPIGSAKANSMGAWTITPTLADGTHSLTVTSEDASKNTSVKSAPFALKVESGVVVFAEQGVSEAPAQEIPASSSELGTQSYDQGGVEPIVLNRRVINSSGDSMKDAGGIVQVIINNQVFSSKIGLDGKWSIPMPELDDGTYIYQVRYKDRAGNWGAVTQKIIIIQADPLEAPQIMRVIDDVGPLDYLSSKQYTNDKTPTLSGVAQPGSLVFIYDTDSNPIHSLTAGQDGRWTYTPTLTTEGTHAFSVAYKDSFGKMSPKSDNFVINLDTSVPVTPTLSEIYDDVGSLQGPLKSKDTTDDKTPTMSGEGTAGSTIRIWDGQTLIASTTVNEQGKWKIELQLDEGKYNFTIDAVAKGGNPSPGKTTNFELTIDTKMMPPVEIDQVVANNTSPEIVLKDGDATNDTTPVLRGTGKDGDIIYVRENGADIASTVVSGGKWHIELPVQKDGEHALTVQVGNPAGDKRSVDSKPVHVVIDTVAPDKPAKPEIIDNVGDDQGTVQPGDHIDDNRPEFKGGGAEAGDKVELIIDDGGQPVVIGTAIVGGDGSWTVTPDQPLPDGEYDVIVKITDPAGNVSLPSDPVKVIIDTKVPGAVNNVVLEDDVGPYKGPIKNGDFTDDTRPTLSGKGENGTEVIIFDGVNEITRVPVINGEWTYELPTLSEGAHDIKVQPVSASGVKGSLTDVANFTVDITKPTTGTFDGVYMDKEGPEVILEPKDGLPPSISDNTLIMRGTGTTGDTVIVYGDAAHTLVIGSTTVVGGKWVFNTEELPDGDYYFNIGVRDLAGNEYFPGVIKEVQVDTEDPEAPIIDLFSMMNLNEGLMNMSLNEILSQGNDSLFIDNGKTQMIVSEKAGEDLKLEDILPEGEDVNNWSQANGTVTVAGVEYNVYQNNGGDAEVMVPQHLMQEQQH